MQGSGTTLNGSQVAVPLNTGNNNVPTNRNPNTLPNQNSGGQTHLTESMVGGNPVPNVPGNSDNIVPNLSNNTQTSQTGVNPTGDQQVDSSLPSLSGPGVNPTESQPDS